MSRKNLVHIDNDHEEKKKKQGISYLLKIFNPLQIKRYL